MKQFSIAGWLPLAAVLVAGCGGGSDTPVAPSANTAPVASITAPAVAQRFKAGDTIAFAANASDVQDGALAPAQLTWWVELHHDTHTHPFQPETSGASGSVTVPVRGETSANIFYRFHLRATDSAGLSAEVTRDVLPQTAQLTLATQPPGLMLALDGQPVADGTAVLGVVGAERDLGAADQQAGGRRYRFVGWSDGGSATHTIETPVADTTYRASFLDIGPINNQAPEVSLTAPATGTVGSVVALSASARDSDGSVVKVEFFDGASKLGEDLSSPHALDWTPGTAGTRSLTARATDDQGSVTTSAARIITINPAAGADTVAPTAQLTAPANLATGLIGTLNLTATASDDVGVASVEFQLDGVALGSADRSAPYAVTVDTGAHASGQHVLRARATDVAGNQSPWATALVRFGGGVTQPAGFSNNQSWITGLTSATAFAQAPDGRLFIAEQGGRLRVVKNGALLATPFVSLSVDAAGERGLIGVALDPAFASNGHVYVYATRASGGVSHNRISRLTASGDVALAGSEVALVDLPNLSGATNHNGGAMHFGADGRLFVGVGDNANSAKPQNLADPFGKMLRFNADGSIPSDNPFFATQVGLARAIWAYGLRNPFTFAVHPGSGRIHINDVGEGQWEEVNLGAPGANYGWPGSEGPDNVSGTITAPLFAYRHSDASPAGSGPGGFFVGFAIAGGAFYPDIGSFPAGYRGQYYFADFVSKFVGRLDPANGNAAYAFASVSGSPVDLLVGIDGAVYVLTRAGVTRIGAP